MSTATALREKAEQAAADARAAEAAHETEQAAIRQRNRDRGREHWTRVHADVLPGLLEDMIAARQAVAAAVSQGEDATGPYGRYVAAHARWKATHNAVADGLASYVNDLTGQPHPDPDERWGRAVYPTGVQAPASGAPIPFIRMLEDATKDAHAAHTRATAADLRAPLLDALEPEDA